MVWRGGEAGPGLNQHPPSPRAGAMGPGGGDVGHGVGVGDEAAGVRNEFVQHRPRLLRPHPVRPPGPPGEGGGIGGRGGDRWVGREGGGPMGTHTDISEGAFNPGGRC